MRAPEKPANEAERLATLRSLGILDTPPEERFDRITRLAKRLLKVPMAMVSLVDDNRQWFKSVVGLDRSETARDISFCGHAILGDDVFVIADASKDERFHDNPLVTAEPYIRFYAGCPLRTANGVKLGTLCVVDREPREVNDADLDALRDLAAIVERELAALELAVLDALTGLSNRRGFELLSAYALEMSRRLDEPAYLLFFDLDCLKQINDDNGHRAGDQVLVDFAGLLRETFRNSDVIGRLGGDEFVVLVTNGPTTGVDTILQRLQRMTEEHNRQLATGYELSYSVGTVGFDENRHPEISALIAEADAQMYQAKRKKRIDAR